jgi:ubiquitin-protein ligase
MADKVLEAFLRRQYEEGVRLAESSDLLGLLALGGDPPRDYIAQFRCKGLVRDSAGKVDEADCFEVLIQFPPDYLRRAEPAEVLTWLGPREVFHPNISNRGPVVCIGRLAPGTSLADILYQLYEIISYQKVTPREDDALNKEACVWVRNNPDRLPVDSRPLKRRTLKITGEVLCTA